MLFSDFHLVYLTLAVLLASSAKIAMKVPSQAYATYRFRSRR